MTLLRCQMAMKAHPWRWVFAIALVMALFLGASAGHALSPAPGTPIVSTTTVGYSDVSGNSLPSLTSSVTVFIAGAPLLRLEKTADSDPVAAGTTFNYTLRYENTGNASATGVTVVDTLPSGVSFQSATAGGIYSSVGHKVTWNLGTLASGNGGFLTVTVKADAGLAVGTALTNNASITSAEGASGAATLTTTVGSGENLVLTKTGAPETVTPNGVIQYTLSYRNIGNSSSRGVRITDTIPSNTAYVAGSATASGTLSGSVLSWDLGNIAAGGQGDVLFKVRVSPLATSGQKISNTAVIMSTGQTQTSNTVSTMVAAQSLLLLKMDTPDPVRAGNNISYTIQLENTGSVTLTGIVLSDPIPVGTTFVNADGGGVLAAGSRQVDWNIGTLSAGQKASRSLTVQVETGIAQAQRIENTATATSNETSPQTARSVTTVNARTTASVEFHDATWQPVIGYMNGDTIRIQVTDLDRNADPTVSETVTVVMTNDKTGDDEIVLLTETGPDTGIFRGSIPTTLAVTADGSGSLTVAPDSRIQASYNDPLDASPVSTASALIDPLGVVFDSVTGTPLAGAVVTLRNWNNVANACDLTSWPVLPPGQVNPAVPTTADGKYAFPLVPAGDYCLQVNPPAGHTFPTAVADADLPSGYTIGNGSRGEKFTLNVGDPPLVLDLPADPPAGQLTVAKSAGKTAAAIGDLIAYSLKVTNNGSAPVSDLIINDVLPHGLLILPGSSRLNGAVLADPRPTGTRTFAWSLPGLAPKKSLEVTYRVIVGPDATKGNGVNTASATGVSLGKKIASNTASVKVKISAGIFTEKGTILGKIFLDRDGNRMQNQGSSAKPGKPDEPGIPGVALYLEDGTRVITDRSGKFSILSVAPGTHVLRVDETTLPKGLELVPLSNRFLGDGSSQFVSMQKGGLVQADFAVRGEWNHADKPSGTEPGSGAERKVETDAPAIFSAAASMEVPVLPGTPRDTGTEISSRATKEPSQAAPETAVSAFRPTVNREIQKIPTPGGEAVETVHRSSEMFVTDGEKGETASAGTFPSAEETVKGAADDAVVQGGVSISIPERTMGRAWEEAIKTMTPDLDFLNPADGSALLGERTRVVIKIPLGTKPALTLNGETVADRQIGRKIDYEKGQVTIVEYVGIRLNSGERNVLQAEIKDPFGIIRGTKRISVTAAGSPERIVIRTDKTDVPADGESRLGVTLELMDRNGKRVPYAESATVSLSAGEIVEKDVDPLTEDVQIRLREGVGRFTIRAPRETGEATITVTVGDREEKGKVFFAPHLRSFFMVGMGEVTIGRGRGTGAYSFLKDANVFDDGTYRGARGAFFVKGRIYEDILLTAAYDSDKKKRDDLFRENDTALDTEDKYPIYGDESKTGYEAVSADGLYVKLEKNRSYLLYGDYKTDLNETRLSAYNRSFNGLKYELNTPGIKLRAFGSHTDQTQVMDALPGKGISGYYHLTKRPVMEGSERVVVEVRDRYRTDRVLSRESKARGSDYEIDYDLGAVLFKGPIPSHDGNYNPIYIVVSYESRSEGDKYYLYGGRGAFQALDWLEIGATGVIEEKAIGNYQLLGTDVTLKLPRKTVVKAEYAETRGLFEEEGIFNWQSGRGWSFTMESEPVEKLRLAGYYRTLGDYFLNLSAVDASRGSEKYGFDATYKILPDTQIHGRFFDEKDDLSRIEHRLIAVGAQTKFKKTKIEAEISNESSGESYMPPASSLSPFAIRQELPPEMTSAKIGLETELRPDLTLSLNHKHNLTGESYHMSQAGLNYQLNSLNRLYLREEYQHYREGDEMRTLFGVESQVIKNTVAFNEYRLADGADGSRNQSVLGLRNKLSLGEGITGNVSAEYLKTISGNQRTADPDAVAGTLALEYLAKKNVKATSRFEHRRELIDNGRDSYLGEFGLAYKLHPDYSLLFRERYFTEDAGTGGQHTTSRTMVGLAYRPLLSNRFNALTKVEYKYEDNSSSTPGSREEAWIFAGEGVWQATPRLQLAAKYAGKLARDGEFSSYTDLVSGRFLYDLTDRWDVGAEYRILTSHKVGSCAQGGSAEVGYRVIKNLWMAAGYSFDKFDADLAGDSYQGQGPYLKLRLKFDETTLKGLRKSPAAVNTLKKISTP